MSASPPNILWICTDQQRYDTIHGLGNEAIRTPTLDALMAESVTFTGAYVQSPVCTPSRASFLTGRYPRTTRCRQNGQQLPADEVLVTKMLADAGYDCGLVGKLHLAPCQGRAEVRGDDGYRVFHWSHHPKPDWEESDYGRWLQAQGVNWDELYGVPPGQQVGPGIPTQYHQTTWCADKTIDFIREQRDGPWLMSVNPFDPHHPFDPPQEYLDKYDPAAVPLPNYTPGELEDKPDFQRIAHRGAYGGRGLSFATLSERQRREIIAAYYAMIELLDDQVGRMLAALDETGQRDNTLVIFMSDHGEMLGDHGILLKGPYFYECAVHVPLIIRWPQRFASNARYDGLVEMVDLVPTLLEAAGLPLPLRVQGRSLYNVCVEPGDHHARREHVLCEYYNAMTGHGGAAHGTMLRTATHKICVYHGRDEGELYDLEADPQEARNLWSLPEQAALKLDLMKRCFDASVFTMDPAPPREAGF